MTHIWVDADSIANIAKQLIIKNAERTQTRAIFVANRSIILPRLSVLQLVVVDAGFDKADDYIAKHVNADDIVITGDIALANDCIHKNARVVTARGFIYDKNNIKQKLNMRDFMDTMRSTGVLDSKQMGGQLPYNEKDKQNFAKVLNHWLQSSNKTSISNFEQ
ncbi:hypothetical protein MOMA_00255 [Moraxella macacae 0408225]|uniref:UPF0178 protein MOMA_00255 n=1 Tax=Moraxella macacae 0408225 TaxID=1230338 RepID=L2F6Y2_9GAMM|nr:DUF188 domain-containing protein [Moraxella macacae]ELA08797.1 hypothetical protein MOMA_00255 [Moraxella macacae 0408225]